MFCTNNNEGWLVPYCNAISRVALPDKKKPPVEVKKEPLPPRGVKEKPAIEEVTNDSLR